MSWTQGQQNRTNQSPFIDPTTDERPHSKPNSSYNRQGAPRTDYNNQRTPNPAPRVSTQRDVAATFTQEGLQTFSTIFSSAVEAAIAKSLPDLIERAVERKVEQMILKARTDLQGLAETIANQIIDAVTDQLPNHLAQESYKVEGTPVSEMVTETTTPVLQSMTKPDAIEEETVVVESLPASNPLGTPVAQTPTTPIQETSRENHPAKEEDPELLLVLRALKQSDGPLKMDELRDELPDVQWGKNASVKMSNFMHKSNGQIERVSRGLYRYREVN